MDRRYHQTIVPENPLFVRSTGRKRAAFRGHHNNKGNASLWTRQSEDNQASGKRPGRDRSPVQRILRVRLDESTNDDDLHTRPYNDPSVRNGGFSNDGKKLNRAPSPPFSGNKRSPLKDAFLPYGEGPNVHEKAFLKRINQVGGRFRWYKLTKNLHGVPLVCIVVEVKLYLILYLYIGVSLVIIIDVNSMMFYFIFRLSTKTKL